MLIKKGIERGMLNQTLRKWQFTVLVVLTFAWIIRPLFFSRTRSAELYAAIDEAVIIQVCIVLLIFFVIMTARPLLLWNDLKNTSGRWWIAVYLLGMTSYFWSNNPNYSLYCAFEYLILSIALFFIVLKSESRKKAETSFLIISWFVLSIGVLDLVIARNFMIIDLTSNAYGAMAVIIACYSWGEVFSDTKRQKKILVASGTISSFLVLSSISTASWWALLIGLSVAAILSRRKVLFYILFILIMFFAYVDHAIIDQIVFLKKAGMTLEQALTGRNLLWTDYWYAFKEKPWLGYGFAMAGREVGSIYQSHAHNIIFSVAVGLGVGGCSVFLIFVLKLAWELKRNLSLKSKYSVGIAAAFVAGLVNGMSYSFIGDKMTTASCVFVCLFSFQLYNCLSKESIPKSFTDRFESTRYLNV